MSRWLVSLLKEVVSEYLQHRWRPIDAGHFEAARDQLARSENQIRSRCRALLRSAAATDKSDLAKGLQPSDRFLRQQDFNDGSPDAVGHAPLIGIEYFF